MLRPTALRERQRRCARQDANDGREPKMTREPPKPDDRLRVVKTLRPLQPGTLRLLERYGPALLCVRYREDEAGKTRYTTVELVVDSNPVRRVAKDEAIVDVRIEWRERRLRAQAKSLGARLDPKTALWRMSYRSARTLGLLDRLPPE